MVPEPRLELGRGCPQGILSPSRMGVGGEAIGSYRALQTTIAGIVGGLFWRWLTMVDDSHDPVRPQSSRNNPIATGRSFAPEPIQFGRVLFLRKDREPVAIVFSVMVEFTIT